MIELVVNDDQASVIAAATTAIPIRDSNGKLIGLAARIADEQGKQCGFTPDEIAEAEKRLDSDGPWHTTQDVLKHVRSLEPK